MGERLMRKLSRTRIQNFLDCPKCFYLEENYKLKKPSMAPFLINSAVDHLLKKEFDYFREKKLPHPYISDAGLDAIPAQHEMLNQWINVFKGVQYILEDKDYLIFGGIDDLWINSSDQYIVVDYKATAKNDPPSLEGKWGKKYRNQIEIYQWLLRKNGLNVSDSSFFVYCNGRKDVDVFDNKVEFNIHMIEHVGDDSWVEPTIYKAIELLEDSNLPENAIDCEYCGYIKNRHNINNLKK